MNMGPQNSCNPWHSPMAHRDSSFGSLGTGVTDTCEPPGVGNLTRFSESLSPSKQSVQLSGFNFNSLCRKPQVTVFLNVCFDSFFLTFISSYVQALRVYACGYQKTTCGTSFSLLFGVLGAKLEASDMLARVLTYWAILLALKVPKFLLICLLFIPSFFPSFFLFFSCDEVFLWSSSCSPTHSNPLF